jgi:hypothetical protein
VSAGRCAVSLRSATPGRSQRTLLMRRDSPSRSSSRHHTRTAIGSVVDVDRRRLSAHRLIPEILNHVAILKSTAGDLTYGNGRPRLLGRLDRRFETKSLMRLLSMCESPPGIRTHWPPPLQRRRDRVGSPDPEVPGQIEIFAIIGYLLKGWHVVRCEIVVAFRVG